MNPSPQCIWMSAGLVAYKLCDRGLECDDCPFDRAMRPQSAPPPVPPSDPARFPEDRRYHQGHTWVMDLRRGRCRVGIDAFAARLLSHATTVVLPAPGNRLRAGCVGSWHRDGPELIPLRAPVSGRVTRNNPALRERPQLTRLDPYGEGWLVEVLCEQGGERGADLISASAIATRTEHQQQELYGRIRRHLERIDHSVGPTLADGGERLHDIRRILGPRAYRLLIGPFLR